MDPIKATIILFAGNFAPMGWAFCEGQLINKQAAEPLFAILGNTYGGDGIKTFALPNLKEAEKQLGGVRYIIAVDGIFPSHN
ncbi:MAG: tail fiber protein [Bacteroidota bacterium]